MISGHTGATSSSAARFSVFSQHPFPQAPQMCWVSAHGNAGIGGQFASCFPTTVTAREFGARNTKGLKRARKVVECIFIYLKYEQ